MVALNLMALNQEPPSRNFSKTGFFQIFKISIKIVKIKHKYFNILADSRNPIFSKNRISFSLV
ncbi:hypothetical protein PN36_25040 [Candidatus Thiomargarita nelsonii]|uniref:Uncharacterized protein n=1 Tax=Candidatus Thiomargarita nelsonii TaxID=1003181 RepID=A0A4E0QN45_9GAMM|nr:hypothetical protein PN36_25040 [Candidatus Thiomargarita nelsonii]